LTEEDRTYVSAIGATVIDPKYVCTCAIGTCPPTTSMIDCAEHGMPQTLEDTEFPGAQPKAAVLFRRPVSGELIAVAPVYSAEQVKAVRERGETLGLLLQNVATIYSPADLERIDDLEQLPVTDLSHKPGCIYKHVQHPGDCYVEPSHAPGCTGEHGPPIAPDTYGECIVHIESSE